MSNGSSCLCDVGRIATLIHPLLQCGNCFVIGLFKGRFLASQDFPHHDIQHSLVLLLLIQNGVFHIIEEFLSVFSCRTPAQVRRNLVMISDTVSFFPPPW